MPACAHSRRRITALRLGAAVTLAAVSAGLTSCGSDGDGAAGASRATTATTGSRGASTTHDASATSIPAYRTSIANVRSDVASVTPLDAPGGSPLRLDTAGDRTLQPVTISNPLPSGAPTTFRVRTLGPVVDGVGWYEVYLPVRPNESTGWVSDEQVTLTHTDFDIVVDRAAHTLTLNEAGAAVATYPVAVGLPATPTPAGEYFVKELVTPSNGGGAYGPIAYGLSAHSPTLVDTEAFADGVIGIHGTNQPNLIGTDASHGCIRMTNDDLLALRDHGLPLGTPVRIN